MPVLKSTRFVFLVFIIVLLFYFLSSEKKYSILKKEYNNSKITIDSLAAENKLQAGKLSAIQHYYPGLPGNVSHSTEMDQLIDSINNEKNKFYDNNYSK